MCLLYKRCNTPILFTCIVVLSCLVVKVGCMCELWIVAATTSYWVGQYKQGRYDMEGSWQEAQSNPRTRPRWTYSRGASRSSHSSMYEVYIVVIRVRRKDWNVTSLLFNSSIMLDYSYLCSLYNSLFLFDYLSSLEPVIHSHAWLLLLCRLKINHDSHELILKFGTVANSLFLPLQEQGQDDRLEPNRTRAFSQDNRLKASKSRGRTNTHYLALC
jgi:hypothetical protein